MHSPFLGRQLRDKTGLSTAEALVTGISVNPP
jgi:hypothetical protein